MHEYVAEIRRRCFLVRLGAESRDGLVGEECVHVAIGLASNHDINTEVELESVDEVRIVDVPLHDNLFILLARRELLELFKQINIHAHRATITLGKVRCILSNYGAIFLKFVCIFRQNKGARNELKRVWIKVLADAHYLMKDVLATDSPNDVRIPIDYLVKPRPLKDPRLIVTNHHVRIVLQSYLPFAIIFPDNFFVELAQARLADHAE